MYIQDELAKFLDESQKKGEKERNAGIIQYHFGFLENTWPTLDETGQKYIADDEGKKRKAERVRQIIKDFKKRIAKQPLESISKSAQILSSYDFISVLDYAKQLYRSYLISDTEKINIRGLLDLMREIGVSSQYDIYNPDLSPITRGTVNDYKCSFLIKKEIIKYLHPGLEIAKDIPSEYGVASLSLLQESLGDKYTYTKYLIDLLAADSDNTCFEVDGEVYYHTSKGKSIINFLRTVFTVREKVEIGHLAVVINNAFGYRGNKYPSASAVKGFLENFNEVVIEQGFVTYKCPPENLNPIEKDIIVFFETRTEVPFSEIRDYLLQKGYQEPYVIKVIDNSPLVYVNKDKGRFYHTYSLVGAASGTAALQEEITTPDTDIDVVIKRANLLQANQQNIPVPSGTEQPEKVQSMVDVYRRDPKVVAWVLQSAKGICELCDTKGYETDTIAAYLEVHHVVPLSSGGADSVYNAVAVCETCHGKLHRAKNREALNMLLHQKIERLRN